MTLYRYFFGAIGEDRMRTGSENWSKLTEIMAFGHFRTFSRPKSRM